MYTSAFDSHYADLYGKRWAALSRCLRRAPTAVAVIPPFFEQIPDQSELDQCSAPEVSVEDLQGSSYYRRTVLPFCYEQRTFDSRTKSDPSPSELTLYAKKAIFNANNFVVKAEDCVYYMDVGLCFACHCLGVAPGDRVFDMFAHGGGHSLIFASLMFSQGESHTGISGEGRSTLEMVELINQAREAKQRYAETSLLVCGETRRSVHQTTEDILKKYLPKRLLDAASVQTVHHHADHQKIRRYGLFDRIFVRVPQSADTADPNTWSKRGLKASSARALGALNCAAKLLKPGGTIVYCSHSLDPMENELIVHTVLASIPELRSEPIDAQSLTDQLRTSLAWETELPSALPTSETRKYGCAFMPDTSPCGPLYICKLVFN
ncbi:hypothetical protein, conserved [Babesia bigemina]|uniref:SAM-dependent methyltransferase RsmB-F/NOP2-type catalytic core domain-containing protein n=1 Tax=Babesia bigemina TaxID=5866 RepID=A0A061D0U8_BABBI|nr:hypothetical protein, conserved [Babesia bigemina]CDR94431.1 hypothetical protein, conserved [Babesia bigemina]|eukprot:XP_012766617.1 hypothetical protein, conserved [Babesia bigemina]